MKLSRKYLGFKWILLGAVVLSGWQLVDSLTFGDDDGPSHRDLRAAGTQPRIWIDPQDSVFYVDALSPSNKVLTCQTAGDQPGLFNGIKWSGPNRQDNWRELESRHKVYEETPNSNVWYLEFKNPTVDDAGTYYCKGSYQNTDLKTAEIEVKVVNPIKFENCMDRQYLVEGATDRTITCRVTSDSPRVVIHKDGRPLEDYNKRYRWTNDEIVIDGPVNESDAGEYQFNVRARGTGERRQQSIKVELHSMPKIHHLKNNRTLEFSGVEGQPTEIYCPVSGVPRPLVYWIGPRERRNLTSVGGYRVNPEKGTVLIEKVNRVDDNGKFTCIAHNDVGRVEHDFLMVVDTPPQIVSFENKTAEHGHEVVLECRARGFPQPLFSIRKAGLDQKPYMAGDGYVKDMDTVQEGTLDVWVHRLRIRADKSQFGIHYCNATNRAGSAERIGHLSVKFAPDLRGTPTEQYFPLGKPIGLTCHVVAYPRPTLEWYSSMTKIINVDATFSEGQDGLTYIFTMQPPNQQQTAFNRYSCKAVNEMGESIVDITTRFTTIPGEVFTTMLGRSPTTVNLTFEVENDGMRRIKAFRYKLVGRTLDRHNPLYAYREDVRNDTVIGATLKASTYTIRNLLPYFRYTLTIQAENDNGVGPFRDFQFETLEPTKPEPPVIYRHALETHLSSAESAVVSDFRNGFTLRWNPPDLDNGDPIYKYMIKVIKVDRNSLNIPEETIIIREVDQMSERPLIAKLGPLETNKYYKVQIQARNKYGDSNPAYIVVYTPSDRPDLSDYEINILAWLVEPATSTLFIILILAFSALISIDIAFCRCCQIGIFYLLMSWCCPPKTNSVISDNTYS